MDVKTIIMSSTSLGYFSFVGFASQLEYFQDDLFPDTKVTWEAVLNAGEWFDGRNATQTRVSLKPHDMKSRRKSLICSDIAVAQSFLFRLITAKFHGYIVISMLI